MAARAQAGFSLPEILVGISIGLLLLAAFIATLDRCRSGFAANASVASLHDTARHALSVLVADVEHAGFLGFGNSAQPQLTHAGAVIADAMALRQSAAPVAGVPPGSHDCGTNFAVDITLPVQATNNSFLAVPGARCTPTATAGGARSGSDTLTLRRASLDTTDARVGRLQLYTRRLESQGFGSLFADGVAPGPVDENAEVRDLEVHTYYVANNSVGRPGWPALRARSLTESGGHSQFRDEEILPGVEDLQVQLSLQNAATGTQTRVNDASLDALREDKIVAVHLWLRIRADQTESGFLDARPMQYADVSFVPLGREARMRRMLVERTVALWNQRSP